MLKTINALLLLDRPNGKLPTFTTLVQGHCWLSNKQ